MSSSRTSVSAIELRVSLEVVCVVSKDSGSESIANIAFVEAIDWLGDVGSGMRMLSCEGNCAEAKAGVSPARKG